MLDLKNFEIKNVFQETLSHKYLFSYFLFDGMVVQNSISQN